MNIEKILRETYTYMVTDEIMECLRKHNVETILEKYLDMEANEDLRDQLDDAESQISELEEELEASQEEVNLRWIQKRLNRRLIPVQEQNYLL